MKTPQEIVTMMLAKDEFSRWMGVQVKALKEGYCIVSMEIKPEMVNGFTIAHGGITYSLADSALAFASNSRGAKCVSVETSISHVRPCKINDTLFATCTEMHRGRKIAVYQVDVLNQEHKLVALFKGTVHVSDEVW